MTAQNKKQPDDDLARIEAEFFGEPDPFNERAQINDGQLKTKTSVERALNPTDAESVIGKLQDADRLPMSVNTPHLIALLKYLSEKLEIGFKIDNETCINPHGKTLIPLGIAQIDAFLKRGAAVSVFLLPLLASSEALAQSITQGMAPINESHSIVHWEHLIILLLILGISGAVANKIVSKLKIESKQKSSYQFGPKPEDALDAYNKAEKEGDEEKTAAAKELFLTGLLGELPAYKKQAIEDVDMPDKNTLKEALKYKKDVDKLIADVIKEIEKAMILPKNKDLASLEKKKEKMISLLSKYIGELLAYRNKLIQEKIKYAHSSSNFMAYQLGLEIKKLEFYIDYLLLMKKKWLILIQDAKNEIIAGKTKGELGIDDALTKEFIDLQNELHSLIKAQSTLSPDEYKEKLDELNKKISKKISKDESHVIPGFEKTIEKQIGLHFIKIFNNGEFDSNNQVHYSINLKDYSFELPAKAQLQMWVNDDNKITANIIYNGVLLDTFELLATDNGGLILKDKKTLHAHVNEKLTEAKSSKVKATTEIAPEAEPVLSEIASAVKSVRTKINNGSYDLFGEKIEMDEDALLHQLVRVHKEQHLGKTQVAIRFRLNESEWKKALAHLKTQPDVPQYPIYFNYENEQGQTNQIQQPTLKFNILVNDKQATILVPSNEQYKALVGEIRVLFEAKTEFSEQEIKQVLAEVAKKLGIQQHIKPVTPAAKQKLREQLEMIRRGGASAAGHTDPLHPEYYAEKVSAEAVTNLRAKGLHSLYIQTSIDHIGSLFKNGRLLSTTTRNAKGILNHGMSPTTDLQRGGATEIFTRIHTKHSLDIWYGEKPAIIFSPDIFERLDCYCYTSDQYGSKMPGVFDQRVSPEELVKQMSQYYNSSNEVMFFDSISLSDAKYIVHNNPNEIIERLKQAGVTTIGGKPLKDAVITRAQFKSINI